MYFPRSNILYLYINLIISYFSKNVMIAFLFLLFLSFYVFICAILLTYNLFSLNIYVNQLLSSTSPYGYSRQPYLYCLFYVSLFALSVLISECLLTALVPHYSRFRLRGVTARMASKMAWRLHMVFSVPTMTGLSHTSGYN